MLFSTTKNACLAALVLATPFAYAQNATAADPAAFATALLTALTANGLTGLAGLAATVANSTAGPALLAALSGSKTLFAPTNGALSGVPMNVSSNATALSEVLLYHIVNGNSYSNTTVAVSPRHTIARTFLRNTTTSQIGGAGRGQALVLSGNNQTFNILQATQNVTTQAPVRVGNLTVIPIDATLNLPPTLSGLLTTVAPQLAGLATTLMLVAPLEAINGITIFAPNDAAVAAIAGALPNFNASTIATVLQNHIVNGTVAYSTGLMNGTVSAAGQPFTFTTNSTGTFVTSGMVTARVLSTDAIVANGVVHTIDTVLLNPASNATAAAAAASVAATATGAVAGVGPTGTAAAGVTATGTGGNSTASATSTARAGAMSNAKIGAWTVAVGAAFVGAAVY